VLAGDDGLGVVERRSRIETFDQRARKRGQRGEPAERVGVALRGTDSDFACFFSCSDLDGQGAGAASTPSMLGLWFACRQHGGVVPLAQERRLVGLALRASPGALRARSINARGVRMSIGDIRASHLRQLLANRPLKAA
jgi:hypothetical protein